MFQHTSPVVPSQTGQTSGRLATVQSLPCDRCGSVRFFRGVGVSPGPDPSWHGSLCSASQCALCGKVRR